MYGLSEFVNVLLNYVFNYRKEVSIANIQRVFPKLSDTEQKQILRKYYRHLSNLLAEGIRNLGIGKKELKKRMVLKNPEIFDTLYSQGKSIMLVSSHFENWEFFITAQALLIPHKALGIGKKIRKAYLNEKINSLRERFGMTVITNRNYKEHIESEIKKQPIAILTLADQSPAPDNAYWSKFFNQDTAFAYGPEYMAHKFELSTVFLDLKKVKRGYYEAEAILINENPATASYGQIMEAIIQQQENQIRRRPEAWLWSHKRWKLNIPENLESYKSQHQQVFNDKFKKT